MSPEQLATTVAADIGGTNMRAALVADDGTILHRREIPTPHDEADPQQLTDLIRSVADEIAHDNAVATEVVVGLPGQVDYRSGALLWAPHLPETWPPLLCEENLAKVIGLPVHLANDADVAAVGEAYFGAGRDHSDVAYVTISTGIGAGIVFGGHLVHGDRSLGELGHTIVDWEAWQAHLPATLEDMASGTALTRMAEVAGLSALSGERVSELDKGGDPEAIRIWESAVTTAAVGIYNLTMSFSPNVVVLGGGLGLRPEFFNSVRTLLERRATTELPATPLFSAALGDSAGLVGAARWTVAIG